MPRLAIAVLAVLAAKAAASDCSTWYEETAHQNSTFRNVRDFGAKGDGKTDDTDAFRQALTMGRSPKYTTKTPVVVYVPPGTYMIQDTLTMYMRTQLVGNFRCRPTIKLIPGSAAPYLISATTEPQGEHTDNFYKTLMHVNLDVGQNSGAYGVHWAVAQATAIRDVFINATGSKGGLFCENGGGGFIGDLVVEGGENGLLIGGQQWTLRNLTIHGSTQACVDLIWNWGFAFIGSSFSNCPMGINFESGAVSSLVLADTTFTDVGTAVASGWPGKVRGIVLDRVTATRTVNITSGLAGDPSGTKVVRAWRQGYAFDRSRPAADFNGQADFKPVRADRALPNRPRGTWEGKGAPVNVVADAGCKGDGVADDTACLQAALNGSAASSTTGLTKGFVFVPAGTYRVTDTITVPPGTILEGELLAELAVDGRAPAFRDAANPSAVLAVQPGGPVFLADFTLIALSDAPGAIFLDWQGGAGSAVYDVHFRLYHELFQQWHFRPGSSAYVENSWGWTADHNIDSGEELTVMVPRGWLVQGTDVTLYGTAVEHNAQYNYNFSGADGVITAMMQTETPYWQNPQTAWGLTVEGGTRNMLSFASGFYSWFFGGQGSVSRVDGSTSNVTLLCHNVVGSAELLTYGSGAISNSTSDDGTFSAFLAVDTNAGGH